MFGFINRYEKPSHGKKRNFFTYTLPSEKTTSLIIRGLDNTYSTQGIAEDLNSQSISSVVSGKSFVISKV